MRDEKIDGFWRFLTCISEPFTMKVSVPQTGWAVGQLIKFRVDYDNKSHVEIIDTRVKLRRVITYISMRPYTWQKVETETICYFCTGGCAARTTAGHDGVVKIPNILVPTNTHCSKYLQVSYELKVDAVSEGMRRNVSHQVPIVIGSLSLVSESEWQAKQEEQRQQQLQTASTSSSSHDEKDPKFTAPLMSPKNSIRKPKEYVRYYSSQPDYSQPQSFEDAVSNYVAGLF